MNGRLHHFEGRTVHHRNWCTQVRLCQDGVSTARLYGLRPLRKRICENRRGRRPRDSRACICCRGMLREYRRGRLGQKSGAASKEAKGFQPFLRDLGKDYHWSILCLQEFTAANGEVVTETPEGHNVFATPPWKGQRRLAIVVAAETLPFMSDGSFRVQGRNCALDVCREGKKFRVICSHFSPSSVLHAYAKDLSDLRTLLNSRCAESEVHVCVDAQTGLGTWPTRPLSENIGTATTVSHRAEKQRMLENFIMENMLTATNTFNFEKGTNNIYTCNYNGKHEPQQITAD